MNTISQWNQYKELTFRLHPHVSVVPLRFRGIRWYLLKNELTGAFTRLNLPAFTFISLLDGYQTLDTVLHSFNRNNSNSVFSTDQAIELTSQLLTQDFLKLDESLNAEKQYALSQSRKKSDQWRWASNPLSLKFKLFNPDRLLSKLSFITESLFTRTAVLVSCIVIFIGFILAIYQRNTIGLELTSELIAPQNLMAMTLIFIAIKCMHEFAHAFAIKHWGGHVKEMGITFLVFSPVPYVDASDSWSFQNKYKRIMVSAMGIFTELIIASISLVIWSVSDPGVVKTTALNSAVVASLSTILFNANPLLKFDGYYVLQDVLEIPNLYKRSQTYLVHLVSSYVVGQKDSKPPAHERGERLWLLIYGLSALTYRFVLLTIIVIYLLNTLFVLGLVIGAWAVYHQFLVPIIRGITYLTQSPELNHFRQRSILRSLLVIAFPLALFFFTPVPNTTFAEGSIWIEKQAQIYSTQDGYIEEIYVESGNHVIKGDPILRLSAPLLKAKIRKLEALKHEYEIQSNSEFVTSKGISYTHRDTIETIDYELNNLYEDEDNLVIKARSDGEFFSPKVKSSIGRHLNRGEFIGYVFTPEQLIVQAVFTQKDIGKIRENTQNISIRLAENNRTELPIEIVREVPSSTSQLPNKALGANNGGKITLSTADGTGEITRDEHFQIDFALRNNHKIERLGGIVYVRIEHDPAPLSTQFLHTMKHVITTKLLM